MDLQLHHLWYIYTSNDNGKQIFHKRQRHGKHMHLFFLFPIVTCSIDFYSSSLLYLSKVINLQQTEFTNM